MVKVRAPELEAAGHIAPTGQKQEAREECRFAIQHLLSFSSSPGPNPGNSTTDIQGGSPPS